MTHEVLAQLWREGLEEYLELGMTVQDWRDFNLAPIYQFCYWSLPLAALYFFLSLSNS